MVAPANVVAQLLGLWIILAVAIGVAAVLLVFTIVRKMPGETTELNRSCKRRWPVRVNTRKRLPSLYHAKATADLQSKKVDSIPGLDAATEFGSMREDMRAIRMDFSKILSDLGHVNEGGAQHAHLRHPSFDMREGPR